MKRLSIVLVVTVLALGLFASGAQAACADPNQPAPQGAIGWNVFNGIIDHYDPVSFAFFVPFDDYFPLPVPQFYNSVSVSSYYWDIGLSCTFDGLPVWHLHGPFDGHADPDPAGCGHGCLQYWYNSSDITPQVLPGYTTIMGEVNFRGNNYSGLATCDFTSRICQAGSVMPTTPKGVSADLRQTGDGFNLYFPRILNQNNNKTYTAFFSASSLNSFKLEYAWENGGSKITPQSALVYSADSYRSKYVAKKFSDLYSFAPYIGLATPTPTAITCPASGSFSVVSTGPGSAGFQFANCIMDQSGQSLNGSLGFDYNGPNFTLSASTLNIISNFQGITINSQYKNTRVFGASYMSTSPGVYTYTGEMNGEVNASFNGNPARYIYDSAQSSATVDTNANTITFTKFAGNVYLGAAGGWVSPTVINPYVDTADLFPISGTTKLTPTVRDGNWLTNDWLNGSLNVKYNDSPVGTLPTLNSIMLYF